MISDEDRAHQRFDLQLSVRARSVSRKIERVGMMTDVGLGGAALELDLPLRHSEVIDLIVSRSELEAAENSTITEALLFSGVRVVWIAWAEGSCVRIGVAFTEKHASQVAALLAQENPTPSQRSYSSKTKSLG